MVLRLFLNEFERAVYDGVVNGSYSLGHRNARYLIRMPLADGEESWWEIRGVNMYPVFRFTNSIPVSKLFRYMIVKLHKRYLLEAEAKRVKDTKDSVLSAMKSKVTK